MGRPEPDLHLARLAPGLPARVRAQRGRPARSRPASCSAACPPARPTPARPTARTGIGDLGGGQEAGRRAARPAAASTRTSRTSRCSPPTRTASSSRARHGPAAVRHRQTGPASRATSPPRSPVPANVVHFDTPFLTDIAHNADPSPQDTDHNPATPTGRPDAGRRRHAVGRLRQPAGRHLRRRAARRALHRGDGRVQREHRADHDPPGLPLRARPPGRRHQEHADRRHLGQLASPHWPSGSCRTDRQPGRLDYGERLFQAARFVTEMEYQHLVFEEFARKVQPAIRPFHVYTPGHQPGHPGRVRPRRLPLRPLDARRRRRAHERDPDGVETTTRCRCSRRS